MVEMMAKNDQVSVGDRFGRLVVLSIARKPIGRQGRTAPYAECRCKCGSICTVNAWNLRSGNTSSCGCYCIEQTKKSNTRHGCAPRIAKRLYNVWHSMVWRCHNPDSAKYYMYGARGIYVVDEWMDSPVEFVAWAKRNGLENGLQLDRIDNDGPYSPDNCRIVTRSQNQRNTRQNHILSAFGEKKCLTAWAEDPRCQVKRTTLVNRIRAGWSAEQAISHPKVRPGHQRRAFWR